MMCDREEKKKTKKQNHRGASMRGIRNKRVKHVRGKRKDTNGRKSFEKEKG